MLVTVLPSGHYFGTTLKSEPSVSVSILMLSNARNIYSNLNLVSHVAERTETEGVREQGVRRRAKEYEVTGEWIKLHNEEVHNFSSPNIVVMSKSRASSAWGN